MQIVEDRDTWGKVVGKCDTTDFYHSYDYHHISKKGVGKPVLIHYSNGDTTIALPLLIREIEGTPWKDATSVYGYAGPISNNIAPDFDNADFKNKLNGFLKENRIVSVFSRLHPFIQNQKTLLNGLGKIVPHGKVVNIDLTQSLEVQKQQYNKRLKTYINKEAKEYEIIDGTCDMCLDIFIGTYCENMKRVMAKPDYFFGKEYFYEFLASPQINAKLLVAQHKKTGEFAGGAIFTINNGMVQYHLSGIKEEYVHLNPIKLLIDHVRIKATEEGHNIFNLGGGLGSQNDDSLFYFKSGFSKDYHEFCSWQYIVDEEKYGDLVKQKNSDEDQNSCFFPLYREATTPGIKISEINCLGDDR